MLTIVSVAASADLTGTTLGVASLVVFAFAYVLVVLEDPLRLRKSTPVVVAAGVMWSLLALAAGSDDHVHQNVRGHIAGYGELFLFLTVAMTYIAALTDRNCFRKLNGWLISSGFSLRAVFWLTGGIAFLLSPVCDNMTTALLMGAVAITVGHGNAKFISLCCTSIVIAANASGAFSPFGDITTLMVWQAGKVEATEFLRLAPSCLLNWLLPAVCMSFAVPKGKPDPVYDDVPLLAGWWQVIALFVLSIATAVFFHTQLHLPPALGMMLGLGYLMVYSYAQQRRPHRRDAPMDALKLVEKVEWDTLLFFFGVLMCVGALEEFGYLTMASSFLYGDIGAFWANIGVGVLSAVIDNVPVMAAVLGMEPAMSLNEWLLVTFTAGTGGSMLSVGSAAGVALMGSAHGKYTFSSHLKWTPLIALGYAGSIGLHVLLNGT